MDKASAYIPMDRRLAIARGETLPEQVTGSALFADISGFTPLTEALARELGARRGAEELTIHLNRVYNAVIAELHRFGGSVIGFSGDAITCWLDGDDGRRATACGLSMQQAMEQFTAVRTHSGQVVSLGMKAAIATGRARRFTVGDPEHTLVDVLAGETLDRLAAAEHQAERGEVVVDQQCREVLGERLETAAERLDEETGERFWVVRGLAMEVAESLWRHVPEEAYPAEEIRGWVLPPVYDRLSGGKGEFLAELRPAVALFLRFSGIDYDRDETAPQKLDSFVRRVEGILERYEGSLIQLTVGDKGSYLYAAFGAPIAHEEDAERAASAALEMQAAATELEYLGALQIGITVGRMRTGAYGSDSRRTYGVLGDATNLSARLMSAASPGQILVSDEAYAATGDTFAWERLPNIRVKGKTDPVSLWRLLHRKRESAKQLQQPDYSLPMVGRQEELQRIASKLDFALSGRGQIVGIAAEAGMGKTRLASEVIRLAGAKGFADYAGECQSYGTSTSYLVWRDIWRAILEIDASLTAQQAVEPLEQALLEVDATIVRRLPLLGTLLNLPIPDNELTRSLDAKIRKSSLEGMMVRILQARAESKPILLVLEDCHWLDPLSADAIEVIGRAIVDLPVLMLLVYRSLDEQAVAAPRIKQLPHFTEVALNEFVEEEARSLIALKLEQFFGAGAAVPPGLLKQVTARAAGNPFYIEELLNFLRDRGVDPADTKALATLDLPSSLYSLILTRIDQLTESQNATLKVASVIGRFFQAAMIWGVYPELGQAEQVLRDLDRLSALDLTPLDTPEPELAYLFKHVMIQEVAYESLLYATRAMLHERIGSYIESNYSDNLDQFLNLLAHHYGHSNNPDKKREFLLKAGHAASAVYDNRAAIAYYEQIIELLSTEEKLQALKELGYSFELLGRWGEAGEVYADALELAESVEDQHARAIYQEKMAELTRKQGLFDKANDWLAKAHAGFVALGDKSGEALTIGRSGIIEIQRGNLEEAQDLIEQSLAIYRQLDDKVKVANSLSNLSVIARHRGDLERARQLQEESLALRHESAIPFLIAISLIAFGNIVHDQGNIDEAEAKLVEAIQLLREIGDPYFLGNALNNLGNVRRSKRNFEAADELYDEALLIYRDLGDSVSIALIFEDKGTLAALSGQTARALRLVSAAASLREQVGIPMPEKDASNLQAALDPMRTQLSDDEQAVATAEGRSMSLEEAITYAFS